MLKVLNNGYIVIIAIIVALFVACFARAGYITFRADSVPVSALKDHVSHTHHVDTTYIDDIPHYTLRGWRAVVGYITGTTLDITGKADVGSLEVTGNADVGSLEVTGNADVEGSLSTTENASVGGSLDVTGNAEVRGALDVTGKTDVGSLTCSGHAVAGSLYTIGNAEVGGALGVAGNAEVRGSLYTIGTAQVGGALGVAGSASVGGALGVAGNAEVIGALDVTGDVSVVGSLSTTQSAQVGGLVTGFALVGELGVMELGVTGNAEVGGALDVTGNAEVGGSLDVTGHAAVGELSCSGHASVGSLYTGTISNPTGQFSYIGEKTRIQGKWPGTFAVNTYYLVTYPPSNTGILPTGDDAAIGDVIYIEFATSFDIYNWSNIFIPDEKFSDDSIIYQAVNTLVTINFSHDHDTDGVFGAISAVFGDTEPHQGTDTFHNSQHLSKEFPNHTGTDYGIGWFINFQAGASGALKDRIGRHTSSSKADTFNYDGRQMRLGDNGPGIGSWLKFTRLATARWRCEGNLQSPSYIGLPDTIFSQYGPAPIDSAVVITDLLFTQGSRDILAIYYSPTRPTFFQEHTIIINGLPDSRCYDANDGSSSHFGWYAGLSPVLINGRHTLITDAGPGSNRGDYLRIRPSIPFWVAPSTVRYTISEVAYSDVQQFLNEDERNEFYYNSEGQRIFPRPTATNSYFTSP